MLTADQPFEIGDRVCVLSGQHAGKIGVVESYPSPGRCQVRSESSGRSLVFSVNDLIASATDRSIVAVDEDQVDYVAPSGWISTPDGHLNPLYHAVVPSVALEGLQVEPGADSIVVLEGLRDRLKGSALTGCWVKTWQRGGNVYARLHYSKDLNKPPHYIPIEEVESYQKRIRAGRVLIHLEHVLAYVRGEISGEV
jgi:hypothetical protein